MENCRRRFFSVFTKKRNYSNLGWGTIGVAPTHSFTTRELSICPWHDFLFVPGIFVPGTNNSICTGWSYCPVQMPPHRGAAGPSPTYPVQMPPHRARRGHLQPIRYKCLTFVPDKVTLRLQPSIILHPLSSLSLVSFFFIC
jgi:hypothetical protein